MNRQNIFSTSKQSRIWLLSIALSLASLSACQSQSAGGSPVVKDIAQQPTSLKGCQDASLALPADTVVAMVNDKAILAKELNEALGSEEDEALREYCSRVSKARKAALENHINESLVKALAESKGLSEEAYVSQEMARLVTMPTEEELLAVYKQRASPQAPPFEQVREQVLQMVMQEKQQSAVASLLDEVRKGAKIEMQLPRVKPAPVAMEFGKHVAFKGAENAQVTVVEFADFECPYCKSAAQAVQGAQLKLKGRSVRFAYVHFPLSFHKNAQGAAEASQCAAAQGKFWQMHDAIYADPSKLSVDELKATAVGLGVDEAQYTACLASQKPGAEVELDKALGAKVGVRGTPSIYINGEVFEGGLSEEALVSAIEAQL